MNLLENNNRCFLEQKTLSFKIDLVWRSILPAFWVCQDFKGANWENLPIWPGARTTVRGTPYTLLSQLVARVDWFKLADDQIRCIAAIFPHNRLGVMDAGNGIVQPGCISIIIFTITALLMAKLNSDCFDNIFDIAELILASLAALGYIDWSGIAGCHLAAPSVTTTPIGFPWPCVPRGKYSPSIGPLQRNNLPFL